MSAMFGADVAQLRQLAQQFDHAADRFDQDRMSVGNAIQVSAWFGPVAVRFRHEWDSAHSVKVHAAAVRLRDAAQKLRANADDQERTSAVDGSTPGGGLSGGGGGGGGWSGSVEAPRFPYPAGVRWEDVLDFALNDVVVGGAGWVSDHVGAAEAVVKMVTGTEVKLLNVLPHGSYASAALTGIGLGDLAARAATAFRDRDVSGLMLIAADTGFSHAPAPVSLIWTGLRNTTEFFIPLDKPTADEHIAWMESRGVSAAEIADRYTGVQGFINLGNDNVERKAPWINRAAEAAMAAPAGWLYNMGIKLY